MTHHHLLDCDRHHQQGGGGTSPPGALPARAPTCLFVYNYMFTITAWLLWRPGALGGAPQALCVHDDCQHERHLQPRGLHAGEGWGTS